MLLIQKLQKLGTKFLMPLKYITTPKCSKFSSETFEAKIKQAKANLVGKNDFDDKLISFHKMIF